MKILILCVLYNSYDAAKRYLDSISEAAKRGSLELIVDVCVIDNSLEPRSVENDYENINVNHLVTNKNLGYFGGVSYGIEHGNYNLSSYDYYAISNVDLLMDNSFFGCLEKKSILKDIGCIAPSIVSNVEHGDRNPKIVERTTKKKLQILSIMYKYPVLHRLYERVFYQKRRESIQTQKEQIIYAPHGSFMIFTKQFGSFLSQFSYPAFLFGEEIFIAEELRNRKLKVLYCPQIKIYDSEHVSTKTLKSKDYYRYNYEAIKMLLRRYFYE